MSSLFLDVGVVVVVVFVVVVVGGGGIGVVGAGGIGVVGAGGIGVVGAGVMTKMIFRGGTSDCTSPFFPTLHPRIIQDG